MQRTDIHTHVLHGIDDGAKTKEDAVKLLNGLKSQRISTVCLTPHFYSDSCSINKFINTRSKLISELLPFVPEGMDIIAGAEVYVTDYLFNNDNLMPLCYEKTNFMLVEFPYHSTFTGSSLTKLIRLHDNYSVRPVLAHIERYPYLFKHHEKLLELAEMGVVFQVNARSFEDMLTRHTLLKLIKNGAVHIIATDTHSSSKNPPDTFGKACEIIDKKLGRETLNNLFENANSIFGI